MNVKAYGAKGDGASDDTAAINAAIAAAPVYAAGVGGTTVYFPPGTYKISSSIMVKTGVRLLGAGLRGSKITGNVAGPLFASVNTGTAIAQTSYMILEGLFLHNTSTNGLARAFDFPQISNTQFIRCTFLAVAATSFMGRIAGSYLLDFIHCTFGGATGADYGLFLDGSSYAVNAIRLFGCDFLDSKGGLRAYGGAALEIVGCHFEQLPGGQAAGNGALTIDSWRGGSITGSYWDSCNQRGIVWDSNLQTCTGWFVGGNYMFNCAPLFIDAYGLSWSTIASNHMSPGTYGANANGVVIGPGGQQCIGFPQRLLSGTGVALNVSGNTNLDAGGSQGWKLSALAATSIAFQAIIQGDTAGRYVVLADGTIAWGPGNASRDTNLYRTGVGQLRTDGSLYCAGGVSSGGSTTANRPASPQNFQQYFDTTLGKPIWWDGTNWKDATGAVV
ncbi:MAG: hypothetical protein H0X37_15345 [Herpetosiphonaceae bacterium]|nr:hypothetical protein [Herpetosiphonaceae bacterium]